MNNKVKIGLLWHSFRSGNLGVGALSVCNLELIDNVVQKLGLNAEYIVVGNTGVCDYLPDKFRGRVTFKNFSARNFLKSPLDVVRSIVKCDIVFDIGEGDSFSDIYGYSRFFKLSFSKLLSIFSSKLLILSPQTIGPFNTILGRIIAKFVLNRVDYLVTRDKLSSKVLSNLNIKYEEAIDVAFALNFHNEKTASSEKIKFGLNVSGLLYHGGYTANNQFGLRSDYAEQTDKLIEHLLSVDGLEVHLVPHVVSINNPIEDDYKVSEYLKSKYLNVIVPKRFESPSEAKSYISGMDIFAGARMHSTIAAFSSGVPTIPLAYSRKFAGLFESIGYKRVADLREFDTDSLIDIIRESLINRNEIKQEVDVSNGLVKSRLNIYEMVIENSFRAWMKKNAKD